METGYIPGEVRRQGAQQCTDVDAHVEDGETSVPAGVFEVIERADQDRCVGFQTTGAYGDKDQADDDTADIWDYGQCDVTCHDRNG